MLQQSYSITLRLQGHGFGSLVDKQTKMFTAYLLPLLFDTIVTFSLVVYHHIHTHTHVRGNDMIKRT